MAVVIKGIHCQITQNFTMDTALTHRKVSNDK